MVTCKFSKNLMKGNYVTEAFNLLTKAMFQSSQFQNEAITLIVRKSRKTMTF